MADIPTLEPAPELAEPTPAKPHKRSWLLLTALLVLLLAGGAVGAWLFLHHSTAHPKSAQAHPRPAGPAIYVSLDPPFVTNFQPNELARFLQISVQVMAHDKKTVSLIKANNPVIRNNLVLLFSNQKYTDLETAQGKDRLRAKALAAVRKVVAAHGGDPSMVGAIYFTSFVMQ